MRRFLLSILFLCILATHSVAEDTITNNLTVSPSNGETLDGRGSYNQSPLTFSLEDIVADIYNAATEIGEVDYEQLQSDLYLLHESPIDLNHTSDEELAQLYFLSPRQIDDILLYVDQHPFQSLYELRLIPSLTDYEIRDLLPFVQIINHKSKITNEKLYPREVFAHAQHEIITRVDARNIEAFEGSDPMFAQLRYRFDYQRRVIFGGQLRRPAAGKAKDLQYGLYLQLRDIAPHVHTIVGGNFQASFGQGLVIAPVFHSGKSAYVTSVGQQPQGLRYYSSADGEGLHGAGTTLRFEWSKATRLDASVFYSFDRYNDTIWRHLVGANLTMRHKRLELQLTGIESIYSDSIHPYRNAKYNRHYFRGRNQAALGASFRFNYGWFDLFGEFATAQNNEQSPITNHQSPITKSHWGIGALAGARFYPTSGISFLALYRYYSPYFDNQLAYAFSETSRLGDENGGYLGFDITRWRNWHISGYGDVFYFSGYKYGLGNDTCTIGYDAVLNVRYNDITIKRHNEWWFDFRARAKQKGSTATYSLRLQYNHQLGPWSLRTTAESNLTNQESKIENQKSKIGYGVTVYQDLAYSLPFRGGPGRGLSFRIRAQFFDAQNWANRIYTYEHDVLYTYSIPATYGLGGRFYLCLRWQIIPQLALYFRASETIYARDWYISKHPKSPITNHKSQIPSRTDLHLLLRAKL